jgi:glycosyltransferase involved in cell wall biosynthesis
MTQFSYAKEVKERSKVAVILCVFVRLENLEMTLNKIKDQTNKDFDFYICDNSNKEQKVIGLIKKHTPNLGVNLSIKSYKNEFKQFSRFLLARDLAEDGYEKIIFFDDDEILPLTFIDECLTQYEPGTVKTFWAHKINKIYKKKIKLENDEIGNYAGTGGLICDSSIFLNEDFFDCPEEYWIIDDLWLSFYLLKYTDYKIKALKTDIKFINDAKATFLKLKQLKQEFSEEFIIPESEGIDPLE